MNFNNLALFLLILTGLFLIFNISIKDYTENIQAFYEREKKKSIKEKIEIATNKKREKGLTPLVRDTKAILKATNRVGMFSTICLISSSLLFIGILISITIRNYYLIPILSVGLSMLPFQYINFSAGFYRNQISEDLSISLSAITTAYSRNDDVIKSIEENVNLCNPSIKFAFDEFLIEVKCIRPDVVYSLENLKNKIDNDIFREWVKRAIKCQKDRTLKSLLMSTVSKFSIVKIYNEKIHHNTYLPVKRFALMTLITYGFLGSFFFMEKEWWNILTDTIQGKIGVSVIVLWTFISIVNIVKICMPIDYKSIKK
ncbi:hypothetical protein PV669_16430 [Clostridioides difficile]|nr:hypothetical protein [Clostridioides difficile]MCL6901978.1 hypothetical protein [Clostridioides difficile]MCP3377842.1 hypothetical protein [Clostridioides difficile]MDE3493472.1 hypothetical protein [Clostridioides difficile]MDE3707877.1 hypothetical protein [Clostridioides difficile]